MKKRGFTLIELLVVIAIIALLAAILFPVFARARENARRTSCQTRLKQLALGVEQYKNDYDNVYPFGFFINVSADADRWTEVIQPYIKSTQILTCPSSLSAGTNLDEGQYGMNQNIAIDGSVGMVPLREPVIARASEVYLAMDSGSYRIRAQTVNDMTPTNAVYFPGHQFLGADCSGAKAALKKDCEVGRHFEGVNIAFADGHVKWTKGDVVFKESQAFTTGGYANSDSAWNPYRK